MAEQQPGYEFATVEARELQADRQTGWERFTQFTTWAVVIIVAVLIVLALFVA